jgi:acyl-CoA synthetase (AMP-forming)/AMP-acid ligase II
MSCEGVVEAAVVGLPDDKWGDRVHAVVSGREDLDPETVKAWARDHLAGYKRPKGVEVWPELPKSAANKILRRKVRETIIDRDATTAKGE